MIGQRYREKKTAVLDVFRRYLSYRGTTEDGVDQTFLELRAEALEKGQYVLAIVGETKAGKSTLINALLGERILPTDVLQSSSAIVEIFKSEKKFVEVHYADGHSEEIYDDPSTPEDEAFEHLRRIAALQDRFRAIPTTLIDACIVQGRIRAGCPIPLIDLESASRLPLNGKDSLVEEYVKERTLAQIPVEIRFGFPLKYAFDELRLVDSPGVNALGGVQDRTFAYIHKANAVLFVHSLESPIEESSFREFITQIVPNHTRKALFLVLSKSGFKSEIEIDEKVNEARSLFNEEFDSNRVLHVDSVLKIVGDELVSFNSAPALKVHYLEKKKYYEQRYKDERRQEWRDEAVNFDTKLKLLNNTLESLGNDADDEAVRSELRRESNFDLMEQMLDDFSVRAPELQLAELLIAVKRGYDNQISAHEQSIHLLTKKRKHPQTFENDLNEIRGLLSLYQLSMHEFVERTTAEYVGTSAKYRVGLEQIKSQQQQAVQTATDGNMVRKVLADFHDANRMFIDGVAREVRDKFKDELARLDYEFKSEHSITVPTVDIDGIEAKAKDAAYRETEVPREPSGFWEWTGKILSLGIWSPKGTTRTLDSGLFLSNLKSGAASVVDSMVGHDYKLISDLLDNFTADFKRALQSLMNGRKKALDELQEKKATNDEILADIATAENRKKEISAQVNHANEMLEDLR